MHTQSAHPELPVNDFDVKAYESAKHQAASIASGVSHEFSSFVADMEDLIKETASLTGDDLERAKKMLSARVIAARQSIEGIRSSVSDQVRKSSALTNEYVHDQPWKVIGAVAAVSFLLGVVSTRRS